MDAQKQHDLIQRVMNHKDQYAFGQLIKDIYPNVLGVMYKYKIHTDYQKDIYQEVCIRLWNYLIEKKFKEKHKGKPFVSLTMVISSNLCIDHLRLKKKHNKVPVEFLEFGMSNISSNIPQYDELVSKQNQENFERFIKSLPREQRIVYLLRELREKSFKEIADYLGIPLGTAVARMRYARLNFEKNREKFNL